ncbi:glycosyltransferase [Bacteroidales bacterium OttesenSCG-928-B11]|nr:glycosyltransferase [Bacteroidales bacterium OttesenSCG-928-E04]MDL2309080.1 glycosyltransferase [Bacteroidales bacterium OttesenSCG-928-C03]MDL2312188.1 glycosyltransferase [Bacteroidales bacterium OttesenSCG-928-B11]MDL2326243.1 glycosyltransferase [Bacteroidales bacterium OttesenSCG-928-A14]
MIEWISMNSQLFLLILFGLITLVILLYHLLIFAKFSFHKAVKIKNVDLLPVSIVISARNEAHHLIKTLPLLLEQQYNNYEVVVVNDNSNDETEQVIRDFMVRYTNLKLVNLTSSVTNIQGKKFPLSIGIKSASHELLLLTDADCAPSSPYWLINMAKHFKNKTSIVLGYSTTEKRSSFMNLFSHFDNLQVAISYFSYALAKMPHMGIGKNLAYTRTLFYERKGFASHNHIHYGDDDIFINKIANSENCDIEYYKEAFTISRYKPGLANWFHQKIRYQLTSRHYKKSHKFLLRNYSLFSLLFYVAFGFALCYSIGSILFLSLTLGVFLLKTGIQYLIFGLAAKKLEERQVIPFILLFDILYVIIYPFICIASLFSRHK